MAYGDVVQVKSSSYTSRSGSGDVAVAFDSAVTAGNIVVAVAYMVTMHATQTLASSSGETFTERHRDSAQKQMVAWTLEDADGGSYTLTWTRGGTANYCGLTIFEIEATPTTEWAVAVGNAYTEYTLCTGDDYVVGERGIMFTSASQRYDLGTIPATLPAGFDNPTALPGVAGASQFINAYSKKVWTVANQPYVAWLTNNGAFGGSVDGDGFIFAWVQNPDQFPAVNQPANISTKVVNTESSTAGTNGTSLSLTLSPAPQAGNVLILGYTAEDGFGSVTTDDPLTDGYTVLYYDGVTRWYIKLATGTDDTSLTIAHTTSTERTMLYAELTGLVLNGDELTLQRSTDMSTLLGTFASTSDGSPLAQTTGEAVWLYLATIHQVNTFADLQVQDLNPGTWGVVVGASAGSSAVQMQIGGIINDASTVARAAAGVAPSGPAALDTIVTHRGALLLFGTPAPEQLGGDSLLFNLKAKPIVIGELPYQVSIPMLQMGDS